MHVRIQSLRRSEAVLGALREDGWAVEFGQDGAVCARHPLAADEGAARSRLHVLGLLTSGSLRIEFCHAGPGEGAEQEDS
jgi:hypothetical protein